MSVAPNRRSTRLAALLACLLQASTAVLAEETRVWKIEGVEIDDELLFDAEYFRQTIEDSKRAVVENIDYETIDGEIVRIEVEPVAFSEIYISGQRFIGLPIVCGKYRSSKSRATYRYIFLGSTAFTFVEEKGGDFDSSWSKYCGRR